MHSALVIVEKPNRSTTPMERERSAAQAWSKFLNDLHIAVTKHEKQKRIESISDGCMLITLEGGADALADVLHAASECGLPYRVLFFKKPPEWTLGARRRRYTAIARTATGNWPRRYRRSMRVA